MKVIVGKNSGFCAGVKYTIQKAEEELQKNPEGIDCLGEIIHNEQVIDSLTQKGLHTIEKIEDATKKVLIRAHGASQEVYEYAKQNAIELIDLTCPNVLKIHHQVQEFAKKNYFIFLLGVKNHPETIGTFSFCGENSYLIENLSDVPSAISSFQKSSLHNCLIISQTTFHVNLFEEITDALSRNLASSCHIHIEKSICNATDTRQKEARDIASQVDLMIVIGGKNSSNTKKLYEVSKCYCKNVLSIQTKNDLQVQNMKDVSQIGIIAGASTPNKIIEDVVEFCSSL